MHQYKLIKEIRSKAFKKYISDPFDDEARKVFVEANRLFLVTEKIDDDDDDDQFDPFSSDDDENNSGFNIFGGGEDQGDDSGAQASPFRKVKLIQRDPIDPPFGLKVGLCFDSVSEYQDQVLQAIKNIQAGNVQRLSVISGIYEPFVKDKVGRLKKKYQDVLKDIENATRTGTSESPRKLATFEDFVVDELGNITKAEMSQYNQRFLSKSDGNLGQYISRNQVGATVTKIGAGQLEFLARMYFMSVGGSHPGIVSAIKVGESVPREQIVEQEKELYRLAPSTVGYHCLRTLRDYLSHAVVDALEPIVDEIHLNDLIEDGMDKVMDAISSGQYKFGNANVAAWAFQIIKNLGKDYLKKITDYDYDDTKAVNWAMTLSFPYDLYSKANPSGAESLKSSGLLNYKTVDTEKAYNIKGEQGKFYKYVYDNEYDFIDDMRASNGFFDDAEMGQKETAGRKKQELPDSPLYFKNLSLELRKRFMTSLPKLRNLDSTSFPEISTSQVPALDTKGREILAKNVTNEMQQYIGNVVSDIYNKIISDSSNKYSQKNIMSYLKYNPDLVKKIIKGLLNFGVYEFQRDNYKFITGPETYVGEFFNDVFTAEYPDRDLPTTISNGKNELPIYQKSARSGESFMQDIRRIVLGTGTASREILPLALKGDKESDEEFRRRAMTDQKGKMNKSAGFLIQEPKYLRALYKMMAQMSANALVGRSGSKGVDESSRRIKSIISEIRKGFDTHKKQVTKNFIQSWN